MNDPLLNLVRLLLQRLERISADSHWAHRASGVRGALLKAAEDFENQRPIPRSKLDRLIQMGFTILEASIKNKQA